MFDFRITAIPFLLREARGLDSGPGGGQVRLVERNKEACQRGAGLLGFRPRLVDGPRFADIQPGADGQGNGKQNGEQC